MRACRCPAPSRALVGPSAAPQIEAAQETAYARSLRDLLEPRMVALLEATMWRQIRDPEYLLGALKTYRMMTGLSQMDPDFAKGWWTERLPEFAETPPFPTEAALTFQLDAIDRMAYDASYVPPDDALVDAALQSVCSIPLAKRAYDALRSDPAATALPDWIPASFAGPNGPKVFVRRSEKTLRVGIDGLYTYKGFHDVVLDRLQDVAAQAALDRSVFAGGCPESAEVSVSGLADDMLKLYYEDFIAQWDGFLLRHHPRAAFRPAHRHREPQGPLQRRFRAQAPPDRRGRRGRSRPARGHRRGRRRRPAQGRLQGARQARKARQARQEGREVHPRLRRRGHRSTPAARRCRTTSSRSGRRSPRWTARRRPWTRWWRR